MSRLGLTVLSMMFVIFFALSYTFSLTGNNSFYWASVLFGILTIPAAAALNGKEMMQDFSVSVLYFITLISVLVALTFFISIVDYRWGTTIPLIFITPVIVEEFNFRYLLQRVFLKKFSPYIALSLQAVLYSLYYARYAIAAGGVAYPFPYNIVLVTSMFGMGLVYGILAKLSKNFFLPATVHLILWSLFPWLPAAIASTILPA